MVLLFWWSCVSHFGTVATVAWKNKASDLLHDTAFQAWSCVFLVVSISSFVSAALLFRGNDADIEFFEKAFHLVQAVILFLIIFTMLFDLSCSSSMLTMFFRSFLSV